MTISMAAHYLFYENEEEYVDDLAQHNPDLVRKMVKAILFAIYKKRLKTEVFEVTYRNSETSITTIYKKDYKKVLTNMLVYMIATDDDWLLCASIRDAIEKLGKTKSKVSS